MNVVLILLLLILGGIGVYLLTRFLIQREGGPHGTRRDPGGTAPEQPAGETRAVQALPRTGEPSAAAGGAAPEPVRGGAAAPASALDPVPEGKRGPDEGGGRREEAQGGPAGSGPEQPGSGRAPSAAATPGPEPHDAAGVAPERLDRPDEADDLKRISGIGPAIERTLNELGIYRLAQIAAFTPENIVWVDRHLPFRGRIEREEWVAQARALLAGGDGHRPDAARPPQAGAGPLH